MSNTAALLGNLLCTNADINYYTQQSIYWNAKYEANLAKLEEQVNYEEKWNNAFDSAIDNTKDLTAGNVTVREGNQCEQIADAYAHAKVKQYNEELFKNGYSSKEQNTEITSKIIELIENNKEELTKKQLKEIMKYYKEKYAYDYYYTPRKTVIETLKTNRK